MNLTFGKRVLIVAAHPDDEVLGVGGTIPLLKENNIIVDLVICTDGSSTQYKGDDEILLKKFSEAQNAANILGIDEIIRFPFPDMRLDTVSHASLNAKFETLLKEKQYDTVFVQDKGDINLDHKKIYHSVLVACRPYPSQSVKTIYSYYVNSSSEWGAIESHNFFTPNVYVDISETIDVKIEAMNIYQSELREYPHPRSIRAIRTSAEFFGNHVGYKYAEPFKLILSR